MFRKKETYLHPPAKRLRLAMDQGGANEFENEAGPAEVKVIGDERGSELTNVNPIAHPTQLSDGDNAVDVPTTNSNKVNQINCM